MRPSHRKDTCFDQSFWCNIKVCLFYPGEGFVRSTFLLFFTPPVASILAIGAHLSSLSAHSGGASHRIISSCLGVPPGYALRASHQTLASVLWEGTQRRSVGGGGDFTVYNLASLICCFLYRAVMTLC